MKKIIKDKIKSIKVVATDVDGTLTDGGMYYSKDGDVMKKFNAKDGMGVNLLRRKNIPTVLITKEKNSIVKKWAKNMNVKKLYDGVQKKEELLKVLCKDLKIRSKEICYLGDDVNDVKLLKIVGLSVCPSNANILVKNKLDITLESDGGNAAFREIADLILFTKFPKSSKIY